MTDRNTIRRWLLWSLLTSILLMWLVSLFFSYDRAGHEAEEVFDATLAQNARVLLALLAQDHLALEPNQVKKLDISADTLYEYEINVVMQAYYLDGRLALHTPGTPVLPIGKVDGFSNLSDDRGDWRIFTLRDSNSRMIIQTAHREEVREEVAKYILTYSLAPLLLTLPLTGILIWLIVSKGLRPLQRVATEVASRSPSMLEPVSLYRVPGEIRPLVTALNKLLQRVSKTFEKERQFTADAAHELRTPLAAIKTHAEVAQRADTEHVRTQALDAIVTGVNRATHLVSQLLTLARTDDSATTLLGQAVDLHSIAVETLSGLSQAALNAEINLNLVAEDAPYLVRGDGDHLSVLVRNLVDNAIRYSPHNTQVSVQIFKNDEETCLRIEDEGPGIRESQRERMFQRFTRGENVSQSGSGLGLSIVGRIAELHGARMKISDANQGKGLAISLYFPTA